MEEGYTLEEVFEEDAIQDIRRGLWEKAPEDLREDVYDDFPSPSLEEIDRMVENYRISFVSAAFRSPEWLSASWRSGRKGKRRRSDHERLHPTALTYYLTEYK